MDLLLIVLSKPNKGHDFEMKSKAERINANLTKKKGGKKNQATRYHRAPMGIIAALLHF